MPIVFAHGKCLSEKKPQAVQGITTGLVFWDKTAIDWDYLEWFLGEHRLHQIPEWIMPTAQGRSGPSMRGKNDFSKTNNKPLSQR